MLTIYVLGIFVVISAFLPEVKNIERGEKAWFVVGTFLLSAIWPIFAIGILGEILWENINNRGAEGQPPNPKGLGLWVKETASLG